MILKSLSEKIAIAGLDTAGAGAGGAGGSAAAVVESVVAAVSWVVAVDFSLPLFCDAESEPLSDMAGIFQTGKQRC